MKFKIVFYLFLFVCIVLFYQIFNTNKILNHQDSLIQMQYQDNQILKDSLSKLRTFRQTYTYFSLSGNPQLNARIKDVEAQENLLRMQLLAMNVNGDLNGLIASLKGRFLIDQIKVINQKWVFIGFQSDVSWGQALLEYKKKTEGEFHLKALESFVLPL